MSQKTVCNTLESAAVRAEYTNQTPATSKQCWFLAGLIDEETYNEILINSNYILTKGKASKMIDEYLKMPVINKAKDVKDEPVEKKIKGKRERMTW